MLQQNVQDQKEIIASRNKQLVEVGKKLNKLDDLLLNGEVDGLTFNRLHSKLSEDRSILMSSRQESLNESAKWNDLYGFLNRLASLQDVYHIATLPGKHSLIRQVFQPFLIYSNGMFKAKIVAPDFADKI